LVANVNIRGQGLNKPTYIPQGVFDAVRVRKGQRQSFYVTSDGPYLRATRDTSGREVSKSNSDINIHVGVGKRYPIKNSTFQNRAFNGIVQYKTIVIPTKQPTPRPTRRPTKRPTRRPTPRPTARTPPFRIKMYWQRGYFWQESYREYKYCMECRNDCRASSIVHINYCGDKWKQKFVAVGNTLRPAGDRSLCLTVTGTSERYPIRLYKCGQSGRTAKQQFVGLKMNGQRFELQPKSMMGRCVSQLHHPKPYERIYPEQCFKTRRQETTYWVKY